MTLTFLEADPDSALTAVVVTVDRTEIRLVPVEPAPAPSPTDVPLSAFLAYEDGGRTWALRGTVHTGADGELRFRTSELQGLCRRRAPRLDAELSVDVCVWDGSRPLTLCTRSVNVSANGVLLAEAGELRVGCRGRFWLHVTPDTTVNGDAIVVRVHGGRVALEFQAMTGHGRDLVNDFVFAAKRAELSPDLAAPDTLAA